MLRFASFLTVIHYWKIRGIVLNGFLSTLANFTKVSAETVYRVARLWQFDVALVSWQGSFTVWFLMLWVALRDALQNEIEEFLVQDLKSRARELKTLYGLFKQHSKGPESRQDCCVGVRHNRSLFRTPRPKASPHSGGWPNIDFVSDKIMFFYLDRKQAHTVGFLNSNLHCMARHRLFKSLNSQVPELVRCCRGDRGPGRRCWCRCHHFVCCCCYCCCCCCCCCCPGTRSVPLSIIM